MAWLVSALLLCLLALSQALPLLAERGEHTPWQSICTTSAHAPSKGVRLPLLLTFSSFKYRLTVRNLVASMRQAQRTHDQCPHHRASAVDPREDCGPPPLDWAEKLFVLCLDVQMQSWCESQGLNCVPIYRHIPSAQSATQQWTDETFGEVCWRAVVRVLLLLLVLLPPPLLLLFSPLHHCCTFPSLSHARVCVELCSCGSFGCRLLRNALGLATTCG